MSLNNITLFRKGIGFLLALTIAAPCYASSTTEGYISNVTTATDGSIWFVHGGTRVGGLPSCASLSGLWILDPQMPGREAVLAALLSAQARHALVGIQGTGDCFNTHERVAYLIILGE